MRGTLGGGVGVPVYSFFVAAGRGGISGAVSEGGWGAGRTWGKSVEGRRDHDCVTRRGGFENDK